MCFEIDMNIAQFWMENELVDILIHCGPVSIANITVKQKEQTTQQVITIPSHKYITQPPFPPLTLNPFFSIALTILLMCLFFLNNLLTGALPHFLEITNTVTAPDNAAE